MKLLTICLLFILSLGTTALVGAETAKSNSPEVTTPVMGDKQKSLSITLTIDQVISMLLEQNPDISASKWNEKAAESRLDTAERARLPVVTAEGGYQYYSDRQRLVQARYNGEIGNFDRNIYRGDLVARLPLFTGGRISSDIKASEFQLDGVHARSLLTRDQLIFTAKSIFYSILAQEDLINSLNFSLKALQQQRKTIEQMMMVRKAAKVDLLRIEVRIVNLEQSIVKEENTFTVLKRTLANLIGMRAQDDMKVQGSLALDGRIFDKKALLLKAFEQRPDFKAVRADMQAQGMKVSVAKADYLPTVSAVGSYGVRGNGNQAAEQTGARSTNNMVYGGVAVSIPIFDLRIPSRVSEEKAKLQALEDQVRKIELQVGLDVETSLLDVTSSVKRVRANEKAVEQAKESLRIEQQKYSYAKGSVTDVLDAQSALLQAETNYSRALADYQIARARLELSTGGSL
jgi:outer membrane protein